VWGEKSERKKKGFAVGHEIQTFLIITTLIINL